MMYENVIKDFEDVIDITDKFNTFSFNFALNSLKEAESNLRFLLGVPGSGKTFLLNVFHYQNPDTLYINKPLTKEQFENFTASTILIDEAQLLDKDTIEYIRILADEKRFTFVLAMHLKETEEILSKEHFKSRTIDIIKLNPITEEEMIQYINKKLLIDGANHLFTEKEFHQIYKYTKGNFRYIKKFVRTLFKLLNFAVKHNLEKYKKINSCLITMTAIKLGLEDE